MTDKTERPALPARELIDRFAEKLVNHFKSLANLRPSDNYSFAEEYQEFRAIIREIYEAGRQSQPTHDALRKEAHDVNPLLCGDDCGCQR